jgi:hypothetical protein
MQSIANHEGTETQTVTIPVEPPRDPSEYRSTTHFTQRLKQRVAAEYSEFSLPGELIREGRVTLLEEYDSEAITAEDYGSVIALTTTGPKQRPWTLIAALRPPAFGSDDELHRAITIYQGTPPTAGGDRDA